MPGARYAVLRFPFFAYFACSNPEENQMVSDACLERYCLLLLLDEFQCTHVSQQETLYGTCDAHRTVLQVQGMQRNVLHISGRFWNAPGKKP